MPRPAEAEGAPEAAAPRAPRSRRRISLGPIVKGALGSTWKSTRYLLLLSLLGAGGYAYYQAHRTRTIPICIVTDNSYRIGNPDARYELQQRFLVINDLFQGTGVRWAPRYEGDAFASEKEWDQELVGALEARREELADSTQCKEDVVLGLTGGGDATSDRAAVAPFNRTLLLWERPKDPAALKVLTMTRALASLFGAFAESNAVVTADAPNAGPLDETALRVIGELKMFDFRHGATALSGSWGRKIEGVLGEAFAAKFPTPAVEVHRQMARAFAAARQFPESIAHMRQAVALKPNDGALRMELALSYVNDSNLPAAIVELTEAVRLDPADARPHALLGAVHRKQLHPYDAIQELRTAVKLDPKTPAYQTSLAQALQMHVGNTEEAKTAIEAALRLEPHDPHAYEQSLLIESAQRAARENLSAAEQAARANPRDAEARRRLAAAQVAAGRADDARATLRALLSERPSDGSARIALSRIEYDRGDYAAAEREFQAAENAGAKIPQAFADALKQKLAPK